MDTVGVGSMQVDTSKIAEMQKKKSATKKKKKGSSSTKTFKCVCCGKECNATCKFFDKQLSSF